ncbi:hypothetical protein BRADI_2g11085v3 [Brachypodium distachyon]|uniref:Uncharacterized protein n=1 Tax=Brachypodium distachyon TaxID=15368 RepID=A0A2K2D7W2_BRADI|nr:hypothetical protein BRADI_2g11085v3 [Brachypodium distachyon]
MDHACGGIPSSIAATPDSFMSVVQGKFMRICSNMLFLGLEHRFLIGGTWRSPKVFTLLAASDKEKQDSLCQGYKHLMRSLDN